MNRRSLSDCLSLRTVTAVVRPPWVTPLLRPQVFPASAPFRRHRRKLLLSAALVAVWCELSPALAQITFVPGPTAALDQPSNATALDAKTEIDVLAARNAVAVHPGAEAPVRALIDALARAGRKREALAEADRAVKGGTASAALRAQRGFIRREMNDPRGAAEDFSAALAGNGLTDDQRRNVKAGLAEARTAEVQKEVNHVQNDLLRGDYARAVDEAQLILDNHPGSEPAMRVRISALIGAGKKREALADADQFVRRGAADPLLRAQRGFLRRELNDRIGAVDDFTAALASDRLTAAQRRNVEAGLAEARTAEGLGQLDSAEAALKQRDFKTAADASQRVLQRDPKSEAALLIRLDALSHMGRVREAVNEANRFIAHNTASPALQAQRGFLRRALHDTAGAIEDFTAALARPALSAEQRHNVEAAIREARTAQRQAEIAHARARLDPGRPKAGSRSGAAIARRDPNSDAAIRMRIDVLSRAGRKAELQVEFDQLIARGHAPGWVYAQRGFARRDAGDLQGAVRDFDAALGRGDLDPRSIPNIRYARADAVAMLAEREGNPKKAEASYREFLQTEPAQAEAWYRLGYLRLKNKERAQGAEALAKGLAIRPVATAYLDAANAYIFMNAPLASKFYRDGLDRWYAHDNSLAGRSAADIERIKNEVVQADASVSTTLSYGAIAGRPVTAGGSNNAIGGETRVRFDGRYLPSVPRLEAVVRGLSDKDANGERETDAAIGLRYRPIRDLNLYIGGVFDHFFEPNSENEFVLNWGLGLGSDAYPYVTGWLPYWDFGTFGAWRTADRRVLEDVRANAGLLYEFRSPIRAAIGPTVLATAGYDNLASTPWAGGMGPSLLSYIWLGGDKYRSYDAILSLQVGYVFNVGSDQRQRGWRGQVGVTF